MNLKGDRLLYFLPNAKITSVSHETMTGRLILLLSHSQLTLYLWQITFCSR